jgi:hypothetical protein
MIEYFTRFFRKAYEKACELINPFYEDREMAKLTVLNESGALEGMCTSKIEELFGIRGESDEI